MSAGLLCLSACGEKEPIRIGFIGNLTGAGADIGEAGRNGVLLAVETRNRAGGIDGRRIEVLMRDEAGQPDRASQAARDLIAARVDAIIGGFTSASAAALLSDVNTARVVAIAPTASSIKLAGVDDYLFRINRTTRDNARDYAEFMAVRRGWRRVALSYDLSNRAFSESWLTEFRQAYTQLKGTLVVEAPFDGGADRAHEATARALLAKGSDCVLMINTTLDTARIAQHLRQLGGKQPLLTSEWAGTEQLIEMGGAAVEGMVVVQSHNRDDPSPRYRKFVEAFQARFQQSPGYSAVSAYDATTVMLDAMSKQEKGQPLKAAILSNSPYQGLQQSIAFDRHGDTTRKVYFSAVRNGKFELID